MCPPSRHVLVAEISRFARFGLSLVFILACTVAATFTTAYGQNPALDEAFQKLAVLEVGQGLDAFQPIEQAIAQGRTDETARQDVEARLIAILQGNSTDLAKDYACRQLVDAGSDASLPAVAALLPNPRSSYMARYALEGIGTPAARQTLRESLDKTEGMQKIGVVISLGRLADADAVPQLSALLAAEDEALRKAVVSALGSIGTVPAAEALQKFAPTASDTLKDVLVDAELHAAELLCRQGEYATAASLCESLLADESERVRAGALRGLIAARPEQTVEMILAALAAEESWKRAVAADFILTLDRPEQIEAIAARVPDLPAPGKIAALVSLKNCNHPAVRAAALKSLDQPDEPVRLTALEALIVSGAAEDVSPLFDLASTAESAPVRDAAFNTLRLMTAEGTDEAIIARMDATAAPDPVVVRCALARRSPVFVPSLLKAAGSPDAAVRLEALKALEIMATDSEAPALADLLCKSAPGEEREAADRAVWMSCQKIADSTLRTEPLLAAMQKTDAAGRCAVLPTLARLGGDRALEAVHEAMQSSDATVRDAGYRALANWPDATVADELLAVAKTNEVEAYRIWSLRAYARVVSLPSDRPAAETFAMLDGALKLASRTEDKELIVSRLAAVRAPEALALLLSLLDDAELKTAAVPAVFTLAKGLSQSHPDAARAALEKIQPMTQDEALLQQIPKVLRDIEARKQEEK